ncbi:DNA repair protein XRCC4-like [Porites lutea]|uniref:DNA repair protein XRCC4-like n=1 Tax=Porites lutea TaxID=51062 RepID=UPI003CC5A178
MHQAFTRIEAGDQNYYLLTNSFDGGKNGFDLTVCNGEQVWRETVDAGTVESMAQTADMSIAEFAAQTRRALTGQSTGQDNFVYHAKIHGNHLQFSWKKHIGDGIKFQLGSLKLSKVDDSAVVVKNIFDLAVDQMAKLKQEMSSLKSDNERLSSEREDALRLLEKSVTAKEEMELDLFGKFATVLNTKKAKIRQLKELVNEARTAVAEPEKGTKECDAKPGKSKVKPKGKSASSRQESADDDTGCSEAMEQDDSPAKDYIRETLEKNATTTVLSPSLLLEEEDEEIQPTVKRRRRREPKSKESPAAKLILPKVPPIRKTPSSSSGESSTSSRSRLGKRTSVKSPLDADDLMAEMEM